MLSLSFEKDSEIAFIHWTGEKDTMAMGERGTANLAVKFGYFQGALWPLEGQ